MLKYKLMQSYNTNRILINSKNLIFQKNTLQFVKINFYQFTLFVMTYYLTNRISKNG